MSDTIKVQWVSDGPVVNADGDVMRQGDTGPLEADRARAFIGLGYAVEDTVEVPDSLPDDYDELRDLAFDVADMRGDTLDSKKGDDLREYLNGIK